MLLRENPLREANWIGDPYTTMAEVPTSAAEELWRGRCVHMVGTQLTANGVSVSGSGDFAEARTRQKRRKRRE